MPYLWVFAGPNGSGKSTVTEKVIDVAPKTYINADLIQSELRCSAMDAAVIAEETREYYLKRKEDFSFETVLSTDRNLNLIRRAKEQGYEVTCIYVITSDPAINVARVKKRVQMGGHDVPADKVRNRYFKCLDLLPQLIPVCDHLLIFDNSGDWELRNAAVIVHAENGIVVGITPNLQWTVSDIIALLEGKYGGRFQNG